MPLSAVRFVKALAPDEDLVAALTSRLERAFWGHEIAGEVERAEEEPPDPSANGELNALPIAVRYTS
jgi:hypothetical protein